MKEITIPRIVLYRAEYHCNTVITATLLLLLLLWLRLRLFLELATLLERIFHHCCSSFSLDTALNTANNGASSSLHPPPPPP